MANTSEFVVQIGRDLCITITKTFFRLFYWQSSGRITNFLAVDIGSFGREGDAGIFSRCVLGRAIKDKLFDTPSVATLPNTETVAPYVFLGDEAFPILENLLKPYPRNQSLHDKSKAIFNYRLSRARRIVENAFGLLTQNFRIFLTPIHTNPDIIEDLITSACILHNLMIDFNGTNFEMDNTPSNGLNSIEELIDDEIESHSGQELKYKIRDTFKDYFNTVGSVPWQNDLFRL